MSLGVKGASPCRQHHHPPSRHLLQSHPGPNSVLVFSQVWSWMAWQGWTWLMSHPLCLSRAAWPTMGIWWKVRTWRAPRHLPQLLHTSGNCLHRCPAKLRLLPLQRQPESRPLWTLASCSESSETLGRASCGLFSPPVLFCVWCLPHWACEVWPLVQWIFPWEELFLAIALWSMVGMGPGPTIVFIKVGGSQVCHSWRESPSCPDILCFMCQMTCISKELSWSEVSQVGEASPSLVRSCVVGCVSILVFSLQPRP